MPVPKPKKKGNVFDLLKESMNEITSQVLDDDRNKQAQARKIAAKKKRQIAQVPVATGRIVTSSEENESSESEEVFEPEEKVEKRAN